MLRKCALGIHCPTALDGVLKRKEISGIHGSAYPGGALKHGRRNR